MTATDEPDLPAWAAPAGDTEPRTFCRCGAAIVWRKAPCSACGGQGKTLAGTCTRCKGQRRRPHPVDVAGGSHFATCPDAARFRRPR